MSAAASAHPAPDELAAFHLGKASELAAGSISKHLKDCPACRAMLENVPRDVSVTQVPHAHRETLPPGHCPTPSTPGAVPAPPGPLPDELANHPKYRIVRLLGRGGMGEVYLAEHREMDRLVAIKIVNQSLINNPEVLSRFQREVRVVGKLNHANIVQAHDYEQIQGLHLLVMEYVDGDGLNVVLEKRGPLPVAYACHYIRQAALGLQHAHEQGLVHRDIKPHNLMLKPKHVVKVLEFGLASLTRNTQSTPGITSANMVMGTPDYMAPEQALNARDADIRADIYALGCTLYHLLTGEPPFQDHDWLNTVLAHINKAPVPLIEKRPDVPQALSDLMSRMLAKDPNGRPATPGEVAKALSAFVRQEFARNEPGLERAAPAHSPRPSDVFEVNQPPESVHQPKLIEVQSDPILSSKRPIEGPRVVELVAEKPQTRRINRRYLWAGLASIGVLATVVGCLVWKFAKTEIVAPDPNLAAARQAEIDRQAALTIAAEKIEKQDREAALARAEAKERAATNQTEFSLRNGGSVSRDGWAMADSAEVEQKGFRIQVLKVRSESDKLRIHLRLKNTSADQLTYTSWAAGKAQAKLADNSGQTYQLFGSSNSPAPRQVLEPGGQRTLILEFAGLTGSIQFLQLELPAAVFNGRGQLRLQIPETMLYFATAPFDKAKSIPHLIDALNGPDLGLRREAIVLLGRLGGEAYEAVPALTALLKEKDPEIKKSAARALGQIGISAKSSIEPLFELLAESDAEVGEEIKQALRLIGPPNKTELDILKRKINLGSPIVKRTAIEMVGRMDKNMLLLEPDIYGAIGDRDESVRIVAINGLLPVRMPFVRSGDFSTAPC